MFCCSRTVTASVTFDPPDANTFTVPDRHQSPIIERGTQSKSPAPSDSLNVDATQLVSGGDDDPYTEFFTSSHSIPPPDDEPSSARRLWHAISRRRPSAGQSSHACRSLWNRAHSLISAGSRRSAQDTDQLKDAVTVAPIMRSPDIVTVSAGYVAMPRKIKKKKEDAPPTHLASGQPVAHALDDSESIQGRWNKFLDGICFPCGRFHEDTSPSSSTFIPAITSDLVAYLADLHPHPRYAAHTTACLHRALSLIAEEAIKRSQSGQYPRRLCLMHILTIKMRTRNAALLNAQKVIDLNPSSYRGYQLKHAALHDAQRYDEAITAIEFMLSRLQTAGGIQGCASIISVRPKQSIKEVVEMFFRCVMLSHRWGDKEPLLHDIRGKVVYELKADGGITKLQSFCKIARDSGYRWAWSDTSCINKNDNLELQPSLNSMFVWYRHLSLTIIYMHSPFRISPAASALHCIPCHRYQTEIQLRRGDVFHTSWFSSRGQGALGERSYSSADGERG
ncbi:hypothetical protein DEU56DRAFT_916715 [Suillus clintonianus]|uniref:uncharacterized protein n=1 Tax=Suillus clintonianus TaxID=1904413 RepID=UPI001B85BE6F|nr:uncharacterized protein DEU56DRAFT_916715 [Suillus clintonianus]KAG2125112.1 hypothetical protein DEU56DRAFT_916715 [Suillus clintonianus]